LLAFGLTAFILAELAEEGVPHSIHLAGGLSILAMLLFAGAIATRRHGTAHRDANAASRLSAHMSPPGVHRLAGCASMAACTWST
jgi:hypothetical protein